MFRTSAIFIVELVSALVASSLLPGFNIDGLLAGVLFAIIISLINAFIRPFLIRVTLPLTVFTVGLFSLLINAFLLIIAIDFAPGVTIDGLPSAIFLSIVMAGVNSLLNAIFAIDDLDSYYRNIIKKEQKKSKGNLISSETPGVIFLEIDGLAKPIFARAMQNGYMPTMARWHRTTHRLSSWHTDLASSTPPSQAGILHGSNSEMPAFRWFDRDLQKVFSMSSPRNAQALETGFNKNEGLLKGGMSINNMFSGNSDYNVLTASKLLEKGGLRNQNGLYFYFINPYNFVRSILLSVMDIIHELKDIYYQRRQGVEPRIDHRLGKYPIVRAITTIVMRDIATNTVIGEMMRGLPVSYATFVAYDEVAHHAGIERSEAVYTLAQLDKQFAKIEKAAQYAPRPYHIVILSDHGQSQGATFYQRFGMTLEELVNQSIGEDKTVFVSGDHGEEGSSRVNSVFLQIAHEQDKNKNKLVKNSINKSKSVKKQEKSAKQTEMIKDDVVVLASGNLGLVYFTKRKSKMSYEEVSKKYPVLLQNLANHEGISFVAMSSKEGPVVLNADGFYNLKTKKGEGDNPLKPFSKYAEKVLLRELDFKNGPDILIMSMYDPETEEVAAFEELVGSHGGLGGGQNEPLLFFPSDLEFDPDKKIIGSENLHHSIIKWVPAK